MPACCYDPCVLGDTAWAGLGWAGRPPTKTNTKTHTNTPRRPHFPVNPPPPQALTLLDHLVKNGSERVVDDLRERLHKVRTLADFNYYEGSVDRGSGGALRACVVRRASAAAASWWWWCCCCVFWILFVCG